MKKWTLVNFCEVDKFAEEGYCAIHNIDKSLNLGDITKIDIGSLESVDMITHGSPCQDFSAAGLQKGGDKGSGTRSSLIWNSVQIIKKCNPKFVIWENVKNVLSTKHKHNFDKYIDTMKELGYMSYYKVLNSMDYGIPQSRERVFCISIRSDINVGFDFPKKTPLKITLEECLDFREKDDLTQNFYLRYRLHFGEKSLDEFIDYINSIPITGRNISGKKMGLYNFGEMDFITMPTGLTGTLTCRNVQNYNKKFWHNNKLYKPSPRMCFKLMGFEDYQYEKCREVIVKDRDLYNRAGNSIVVDVSFYIYKELYKIYPEHFKDMKLTSLFSGIGAFEVALDRLYNEINQEKL